MKKQSKKKIIAFMLSTLMLLSLFQNISYYPSAEGGEDPAAGVEVDGTLASGSDADLQAEEPVVQSISLPVEQGQVYLSAGDELQEDTLEVGEGSDVRPLPNPAVKVVTYINSVETIITDSTVLNNGDAIDVQLTWDISNTESNRITTSTELTYDLNATGVIISNTSGKLLDGSWEVGNFQIDENGILHIQYTEAAFIDSDIKGGVSINAIIDAAGLPQNELGQSRVQIAGQTIPVQISTPTVAPQIDKNRGNVYSQNGKNYQTFEVNITVNSDATELVFYDTLGDYLSLSGDTIKINGSDVTPVVSGKQIKYTFNNVTKGDTYTIKYVTEIDDQAFSNDYSWYIGDDKYYNHAKVEDSNGNTNDKSVFALTNKTWIQKSNSVDRANNKIKWTITVNDGNDVIDISGAVVKDVIPSGLTVNGDVTITGSAGSPVTITAAELASGYTFPDGSVGKYTITYETDAPASSSLTGTDYTNTANIIDTRYNVDKSASSTAKVVADWISKEFSSVDLANKTITWKSVIDVPATVTTGMDLKYVDTFATSGMTYKTGSVNVTYSDASNVTGGWTSGVTPTSSGFEVPLGTVKGPTTITITYTTSFDPGTEKMVEYKNRGKVTDGTNTSDEVEAKYTYKTSEIDILQYKDGSSSGTVSRWNIQITNTNQLVDRVNAGEKIYIYDKIDLTNTDGTALSFHSGVNVVDGSIAVNNTPTDKITAEKLVDGRIRFDLTEYIRENPYSNYYVLNYAVDLDSATINGMLQNNITSIKESNYAAAKANNGGIESDLGDVTANGSTNPALGALLTKSYDYTSSTAPYANYSIEVNPNGYDLVAGAGTLTLEDVHGADLQLVLSSVQLTNASGNEITGISVNYDLSARKLSISNIPDATPCILTYKVLVNVEYEENKTFADVGADVTNVCNLFAESNNVAQAGNPITGNIQKSAGWSTSNYGSITISKHSGIVVLGDAEFSITEYAYDSATDKFVLSSNSYNNVITSSTDGTAIINRLQLDTLYQITEVNAPAGYLALSEPMYIILKGKDFNTLTNAINDFRSNHSGVTIDVYTNGSYMYVENEPAGLSINVNKNDQNGAPVQGAVFTLYKLNAITSVYEVCGAPVTTDAYGKVSFTNLEAGTYKVEETRVPNGYSGTFSQSNITLDSSHTTETITATNTKLYGTCNITKKGSDGAILKDVEFGLYLNDTLLETKKTDASGQVVFNNLEFGKTYEVRELASIYGYNLTDGPWTQTITADNYNTWTINAVNAKQNGKIKIIKKDQEDNRIAVSGAVFTLYDKNKNAILDGSSQPVTVTTDAAGEATFTALPYDTYYVRETEAPTNYLLDGTYHEVNLTSDTEVEVNLTNEKRNLTVPYISFKFLKQGRSTSGTVSALAGAKFELYCDDVLVDTAISGADGYVYFMNVTYNAAATYKIVEVEAPTGYDKFSSDITLSGSEINNTTYGHSELKTAADKASISILRVNSTDLTVENDQLKGAIKLTKTDGASHALQGAVYGAFKNGSQVAAGTSDASGVINFTNLGYGDTYTIKELTPPSGYTLSTKEYTIRIGDTTSGTGYRYAGIVDHVCSYEIAAEDTAIELNISKKALTGASEVAGAELVLKDNYGIQIDAWTSGTTSHIVDSAKLKVNGIYTLEEKKAPAGYGYSDPIRFQINADNSITILSGSDANAEVSDHTLIMRDRDISFRLAKVDASGNRLGGAGLNIQIQDGLGTVLYQWNSNSSSDMEFTAQSAKQFGVTVPDTAGVYKEYIYHEVSAPQGYVKATDIKFYLDYHGKIYVKDNADNYVEVPDDRIIMTDEIDTTDVLVSKVKSDGTTRISNAKLKILDVTNGNAVIAEWTSTYSTKIIDGSGFTRGNTYQLIEVQPATGYAYADPITFTINAQGKIEINGAVVSGNHIYMRDASVSVVLNKVDDARRPVERAKIGIYTESGAFVMSYVTDGTGYDAGRYLSVGQDANTGLKKYYMREMETPFGYKKAADIWFALDDQGKLYLRDTNGDYVLSSGNEITMVDDIAYLDVAKMNSAENGYVDGASLVIKDAAGNEVVSWTTGRNAERINLTILKAHTDTESHIYTLSEQRAPFGYEKADDIEFYVDNTYKLYVKQGNTFVLDADGILSMVDSKAVLSISKTDATGTNEIGGAVLIITDENDRQVARWTSVAGESKRLEILGTFVQDSVYTLTEITAPYGYEIAESIQFKLDSNSRVLVKQANGNFALVSNSTVVMKDENANVYFSKVDATNGNELPGALLKITDKETDNVVASWTSSTTKKELAVNQFVQDKVYILTEITAPNGFEVAESIEFMLNGAGDVLVKGKDGTFREVSDDTVVMKDAPSNCVNISKVDIVSGDELPGAKLIIRDEAGTEIDTWVSTTFIHSIPCETFVVDKVYSLIEVTAPFGYEIAESILFKLDAQGDVYIKGADGNFIKSDSSEIIMQDAPKYATFSKVDATNGNELPGAKLEIKDAEGNMIDSWVSTNEKHQILMNKFKPDVVYSMTEITAPKGYEVAETIYFKFDADGKVYVKTGESAFTLLADGVLVMKDAPSTEVTTPDTPTDTATNTSAKTGDSAPIAFVFALSVLAFAGIMILRRWKKREE